MDGRQGKRVGMYVHPSTELFDHGIDSVVCSLSGITSAAVCGLGSNMIGGLHMLTVWSGFYLTTSEHLNRGKIRFEAGIANPTEGLVLSFVILLTVAAFPGFMGTSVRYYVPQLPLTGVSFLDTLEIKHLLCIVETSTLLMSYFQSIWRYCDSANRRPGLSWGGAVLHLLPLAVAGGFIVIFFSGLVGGEEMAVFSQAHGRSILVLLCTFVNLSLLLLIISEMCKTSFPAVYVTVTHLPLLIASAVFGPVDVRIMYIAIFIGLVRFAGLWARFQHELM